MRKRVLEWIGRSTYRFWWLFLLLTAVSIVLCVFAILTLDITTGYVDLLPQEHAAVKNYFKVLDKFGGTDYVVAMVEGEDRERIHDVIDQLSTRLEETDYFDYVQTRADLENFTRYGLLYLDLDTLKEIDLLLTERDFEQLTELAASFTQLQSELRRSMSAGLYLDDQGYLTNPEGTAGLVIAHPAFSSSESDRLRSMGADLEEIESRLEVDNPGAELFFSGSYLFEYEQRNVLNHDMLVVGAIALAVIICVLAIAFKSVVTPLAAMLALGCGLVWTLGLARITVSSLNTVSSIFVIVLMGIGIEYGIALLSRYREERANGVGGELAMMNALALTGKGILTGALTTAGAFFALAFSDFKAMHDMGIVLGLGVISSLVAMLVVLPSLIRLKEKVVPYRTGGFTAESQLMRRLGSSVERHARLLIILGILITIGLGISAGFIEFESNIRNIQPEGMEVTVAEDKLSEEFGMVSDFMVVLSHNEAAMREVTDELAERESVRAVESLATVIPSDQLAKLVVMSRIENKIQGLNPNWLDYVPPETLTILENIGSDILTPAKLPEDVRDKYISEDGTYATYVYPEKNMYEEENVVEFLDDVSSVSTDIAGLPMIIQDSIESTREGLSETTLLSAIAVMLMVVIDFKAIIPTLLALMPLALSMVWMMGTINLLGMKFNLVNIAGAPIILGIGVDFGVYILHRYEEEHLAEGKTIPSVLAHTGRAIAVSGLTVIAAFAALTAARYQGLASLGVVASIGIGFAAVCAITTLPAILRVLEKRRKKGRAF